MRRNKALPPKRGPNPQGMQEGDIANIGKGLKLRSSGDLSYEKDVQPETKVKATYNIKNKKLKNIKLKTKIGGVDLDVFKDKFKTTATYTKNFKNNLNVTVGAYKNKYDKGLNIRLTKKFSQGDLSNIGCPHRENGVQGSDIKGVKPIQVKGKKFIGVL